MLRSRPARRGHESENGSALVCAVFVSFLLGLLGLSFVVLGELEARTVQRHLDRERCRQAAIDAAQVASEWWNAGEEGGGLLPPSSQWAGRLTGWRERGEPHPFTEGLPRTRLSGHDADPDLLLEGVPWLEELGALLGEGLVVERIAVSAPPGESLLSRATLTVTVSSWRGALFTGRSTLVAAIEDAPALVGPELLAAGGDVVVARGADLAWGLVRADGDVRLPGPGEAGHPESGLPRGTGGLEPRDYSPGGHEDWNPETSFRESVLSELIGYTRGGKRVPAGHQRPPRIADPWLTVQAGGALLVGEKGRDWSPRPGMRQPQPYSRRSGVEEDRSHLVQRLGGEGTQPLLQGRVEALLRGRVGAQGGEQRRQRRFVLAGREGQEGLWAENGTGPAKPAADWLRGSERRPFTAVFSAAGRTPPPRVTLHEGAGVVIAEAETIVLAATSGGRLEELSMPGEPFQDSGIDADGDGRVDPGTVGNGRWDCDCDGDGIPDEEPPRDLLFDFLHADVENGVFPDHDRDPGLLATAPHEAFLNLDYPVSARDLSVRVVYGDLEGAEPRPVRDLDGDGAYRRDRDLFTTKARDETGARVSLPLHFRGLVVNATGSVRLGPGFRLHGGVRAAGAVELQAGAGLSFDEALARTGRPGELGLSEVHLGAHAWVNGAPALKGPAFDRPEDREPAAPVAEGPPRVPGTMRGDRG